LVATAAPSNYGWIASWNSTTVPNGTYSLQSVAFDQAGNSTYSTAVSVTVNNPPPTTAIVFPPSGATVSGNQYLDSTASTGVTQVRYELTGGSLNDSVFATATPTLYGWLANWTTTTVPDGTYTLQSVASYAGGVSGTSPGITITVDNLHTTVLVPPNNATLSGTSAVLDASTSGSSTVTGVTFVISGGSLTNYLVGTAGATLYGWIAHWNTTGVANGTYTLHSIATETGGTTATSPGITLTVSN
jgi:hypothetical protein